MATTRRPRLTNAMAEKLFTLASYAESETDVISDGTEDQVRLAKEVREACDWISELARWHVAKTKDKAESR